MRHCCWVTLSPRLGSGGSTEEVTPLKAVREVSSDLSPLLAWDRVALGQYRVRLRQYRVRHCVRADGVTPWCYRGHTAVAGHHGALLCFPCDITHHQQTNYVQSTPHELSRHMTQTMLGLV